MAIVRTRRLWVARLNRRDGVLATDEFIEDISEAFSTAPAVTRYRRTWHVTRPEDVGRFLGGKLGFESASSAKTVRFDEATRDFISEERISEIGSFAHFLVDPQTQLLVFEERLPDIRRQSFVGALSQLLDRADRPFEVDLVPSEESFAAFLAEVPTITRFHAKIIPPNPTYRPRAERARQLIEPTHASETQIESRIAKERQDGLVVEGTVLEDVAEHVFATNGRIRMTGRTPRGGRRFYDSSKQLASGEIEIESTDESSTIFARIADFLDEFRERWSA